MEKFLRLAKINKKGKLQLFWILAVLAISALPSSAIPQSKPPVWVSTEADGQRLIHFYYFWSPHCPHCRKAKPWVNQLGQELPWLKIHSLSVLKEQNQKLYSQLAQSLKLEIRQVPVFFFCSDLVAGFESSATTGKQIKTKLQQCHKKLTTKSNAMAPFDKKISLPLLGGIDPTKTSLPLLTILIATLDAFNPCAFFVLLFLMSLMVHVRSRRKILLVGMLFIFISGLVYFIFMAAWLNVFLIIGQALWITTLAGAIALGMGIINIKDYFWFKKGISLSIPESQKGSLFKRMRSLVSADSWGAVLFGTVVLAVTVNGYEFLCTAGFPMVYSRILTLHHLEGSAFYGYLLLYNLVYILPLLLIVLLFSFTLGSRKLSLQEGRLLKLISGFLMLSLGIVLIVWPDLLQNIAAAALILFGSIATAIIFHHWRQKALKT